MENLNGNRFNTVVSSILESMETGTVNVQATATAAAAATEEIPSPPPLTRQNAEIFQRERNDE